PQPPRPTPESAGGRMRVQAGEDALEGVMRGGPTGQGQELLQPLQAPAGEGLDLRPGVRPTDHRTDGNDDQVHQQVTLAALAAWVAKVGEVCVDGEIGCGHDSPPGTVPGEENRTGQPLTRSSRPQ